MKKKGVALVFTIFILSFFLALSLNIYFLANKKSRKSSSQVEGNQTINNIDIASSLGYQEISIAESFVRNGYLYSSSHPSISSGFDNITYTYPINSREESYLNSSTGIYSNRYSGIQISQITDFFSSSWDYSIDGLSNQKLVITEKFENGELTGRLWQSNGIPDKIIPLWSVTDSKLSFPNNLRVSIGGYRLKSLEVNGVNSSIDLDGEAPATNNPRQFILNNFSNDNASEELNAVFSKVIQLKGDPTLNIEEVSFEVIVEISFEAADYDPTLEFDDIIFYNEEVLTFSIESLN